MSVMSAKMIWSEDTEPVLTYISLSKIKEWAYTCLLYTSDTRNHVERMFDFKERLIKPGALHEGWQTGGSARLTRLAFNLWNGYVETVSYTHLDVYKRQR